MWDRWRTLNVAALVVAALVVVALALLWRADRARPAGTPSWNTARFAAVHAPSQDAVKRERWIVVVQPDCGHCTEHLRWLAARLATRPDPPALGALLVDLRTRPDAGVIDVRTPAGVWWDSAAVWRTVWRRGAYGETFRFAPDGRLIGSAPAGVLPDGVPGH